MSRTRISCRAHYGPISADGSNGLSFLRWTAYSVIQRFPPRGRWRVQHTYSGE